MKLPFGVVAVGLVSLFMDMSSEMIHALLPLYLTGTLGASVLVVGLIEGVGEATAQITKLFSGAVSDWLGKRKALAVIGYGLSALTKPLFAIAGSPGPVLFARLADRVGKGIRGAPRDAMVADMVPAEARGAAYGLRQSLDTVGAFAGPLIAMGLMVVLSGNVPMIFALAIIPALISVAVLVIFVRDPPQITPAKTRPRMDRATLARLGRGTWVAVAIGAVMTLARFSDAFLILRAGEAGLGLAMAPLVLVVMNLVYSATAWPLGALSDRVGKAGLLALGFAVLALADVTLAYASGPAAMLFGVALWGLHMGLTQGLLAAMVADAAPADLRGTAFGVFNLVSGLALLVGNGAAGWIWANYGSTACFNVGALVALASLSAAGVMRFR
jgi:MFS family permease